MINRFIQAILKTKLILITILIAFAVSACAKKTEGLYEKVMKNKQIIAGTEGIYAPFSYHDKDGNLTGFDVDLFNEVAKRLGISVKYHESKWDAIFAALDSKRFDIVASQVLMKPDRVKKYDFSDSYMTSYSALVVPSDSDIKSLADIKGKSFGEGITANFAEIVRKHGGKIIPAEFPNSITLLTQGRVDGVVNDMLGILSHIKTYNIKNLKVIKLPDVGSIDAGFMLRKGESPKLIEEINKALAEIKADGTYKKIFDKYFGE